MCLFGGGSCEGGGFFIEIVEEIIEGVIDFYVYVECDVNGVYFDVDVVGKD